MLHQFSRKRPFRQNELQTCQCFASGFKNFGKVNAETNKWTYKKQIISLSMWIQNPAATRHLQDILGLSWTCLISIAHFQDIYKTSWNCLVSITHFQDIYKTSWNCLVSITHFQDIYKTSSCRWLAIDISKIS